MAKPQNSKPELIKPLIRVEGVPHILETKLKSGKMPEMKCVGYMNLDSGSNSWISYTATIKGNEVLSIEVDEPNMRAVAEESAKIAFVTNFIDQGML